MTIINPAGPPQWYQTYRVEAPLATHWRKASCEEINCPAYFKGWKTYIDLSTDLGQKQYYYITKESKRRFSELKVTDTIIAFTFESGQPCFGRDKHRIQLDRPENY